MVRTALIVIGVVGLILTLGLFTQSSWATVLWPLPAGRLSYIFLASILAAAAAPVIWIGWSGETRAMLGGAINFGVTYTAFALYAFQLYSNDRTPGLLVLSAAALVFALICLAILVYARRLSYQETRSTPGFVRFSFGLFAVVLLVAGGAMVLRRPDVFPWPISPETSVFYGWIFLGAMCYFIFALVEPVWANARGQLLGFLAYDIVLIVPFLLHFQSVPPHLLDNLIIYTAVLVYSGGLAIYFLFLHPATRFGAARGGRTGRPASTPLSR